MCTSTSITLLVTTAAVCASPLVEMAKFKRSELAKIALIAALVLIAPLLSTSMRPPFLYLLLNLLIIFLGAESGILKAFSSPSDEKKPMAAAPVATAEASSGKSGQLSAVEKPVVEKNAAAVKAHKVKKCPSMPSLFFIGSNEVEDFEEEEEDEEEDDIYEDEGQELFAKAEMFIGNFYKQLKIQREESWKKIHGLYHRAF